MAVKLTKGESVNLTKGDGGQLTKVRMGLGWDPITKKGFFGGSKPIDVDLDASCLMFDSAGQLHDVVYFGDLVSMCGSVVHTGDNRTGAGDGDDESIIVDLTKVPAEVKTLIFTVNSFLNQTFNDVSNATCRLVDQSTGAEIATYSLSAQGSHTAQVMAKLTRESNGWKMTAIGQLGSGQTFDQLMPIILPHV